eukprot:2516290-Pyramimonas_sp.AAC.1
MLENKPALCDLVAQMLRDNSLKDALGGAQKDVVKTITGPSTKKWRFMEGNKPGIMGRCRRRLFGGREVGRSIVYARHAFGREPC